MHIREELKEKYPGLYKRTYKLKHRAAAIRLFCLECMGGDRAATKECSDTGCPLYPFRLSRQVQASLSASETDDIDEDVESHEEQELDDSTAV